MVASGGLAGWLGISGTYADWLGVLGSVASVVSLLVSLYAATLITVVREKVGRRILFNVQAPKVVSEVAKVVTWLAETCDSADVGDQDRLVRIRSCLGRLGRHVAELPRVDRKRLQDLEGLAKAYEANPSDELMGRIVTEFRVLGDILPDLVEAKHIGGSDDA